MMRKSVLVLLIAGLALASCGFRDSRLNPRNWFGKGREVAVEGDVNPLIPQRNRLARKPPPPPGEPIGAISSIRVEPTNTGAIVYVVGVADRQGAYRAELVPDNEDLTPENGVLNFTFNVLYPRRATPVGSEATRTIHEAVSLSKSDLEGVSAIRVTGARNAQESRRRR